MEERKRKGISGFLLLADASKAHRRIAVKEKDWGLLACRVRSDHVWLNKVGTYGVGSAGYFWGRLAGALHRLGFYVAGKDSEMEALLFADDWLGAGHNRFELENLGLLVLLLTVLGYPYNWRKFRGGCQVQWIGFEVNMDKFTLGISAARAKWLIDWSEKTVKEGKVAVDDLISVLGRFSFSMAPLKFLRPFLAPLFAWTCK